MAKNRRKKGRPVNGIILLDKSQGISSNKALQQVKHLYQAQKAGHTGSLDPLATGVLPVCLGEATKVSAFLLDADKSYRVTIKLGETTDSADAEGQILETRDYSQVTQQQIIDILPEFTGDISQLPPMYSAVKHDGKRLYELARQGIEVERKLRHIKIYSLSLVAFDLPFVVLDVHCSKGTYVRTLADDIGQRLQCGAHVTVLRRTSVAHFSGEPISFEQLQEIAAEQGMQGLDALLMPMDAALSDWPEVRMSADMQYYVRQGQAVQVPKAPAEGLVKMLGPGENFIGIGQILPDGRVGPKRLIVEQEFAD